MRRVTCWGSTTPCTSQHLSYIPHPHLRPGPYSLPPCVSLHTPVAVPLRLSRQFAPCLSSCVILRLSASPCIPLRPSRWLLMHFPCSGEASHKVLAMRNYSASEFPLQRKGGGRCFPCVRCLCSRGVGRDRCDVLPYNIHDVLPYSSGHCWHCWHFKVTITFDVPSYTGITQ